MKPPQKEKPRPPRASWFSRGLFEAGVEAEAGVEKAARKTSRFAYLVYREFSQDFCWERAAALTFATVVSLLPIVVLVLSVVPVFVNDTAFRDFVKRNVHALVDRREATPDGGTGLHDEPAGGSTGSDAGGPPATVEDGAAGGDDGDAPAADGGGAEVNEGAEEIKRLFDNWVDGFNADALRGSVDTNLGAFIVLTLSALALLVSTERVFNRIWKIRSTRTYFQKFVAFWMILTTSPLLVAASFAVDGLTKGETTFADLIRRYTFLKILYGFLVPIIISCTAFTLVNLFMPKTRVRLLPAALGGCVSGLAWLLLKDNFYLYFQRALTMQSFYGSLAAVPVFLLFVYLSWAIALAGAEIAYVGQNFRRLVRARESQVRSDRYSFTYLGLNLLGGILRAYETGRRVPSVDDVAARLNVYPEELEPVVSCLVAADVLAEAPSDDERRLVPSRAPASIALREVVERLRELDCRAPAPEASDATADGSGADAVGSALRLHGCAHRGFLAAFVGLTLADLGEVPEASEGSPRAPLRAGPRVTADEPR